MSFSGAGFLKPMSKLNMAKWEIHKRAGNLIDAIWWRYVPTVTITVKWPVVLTKPVPAPGGGFIQSESADPNDHYRPELEQLVGRQRWDWNWRIGPMAADNGAGTRGYDTLQIKFRKCHAIYATYFAMKWN